MIYISAPENYININIIPPENAIYISLQKGKNIIRHKIQALVSLMQSNETSEKTNLRNYQNCSLYFPAGYFMSAMSSY